MRPEEEELNRGDKNPEKPLNCLSIQNNKTTKKKGEGIKFSSAPSWLIIVRETMIMRGWKADYTQFTEVHCHCLFSHLTSVYQNVFKDLSQHWWGWHKQVYENRISCHIFYSVFSRRRNSVGNLQGWSVNISLNIFFSFNLVYLVQFFFSAYLDPGDRGRNFWHLILFVFVLLLGQSKQTFTLDERVI